MPSAATWMDLEIITPSEVRKTETDIISVTYMWNPKYGTNELSLNQRQTHDVENSLVVAKGEEDGQRRDGSLASAEANHIGSNPHSKILLYSTGNHRQHP